MEFTVVEGIDVQKQDVIEALELDKIVYHTEYYVSPDLCLAWHAKNNQIYTMIRDNVSNKIMAYVNLSPITDEYYDRIKSGEYVDTFLPPEAIANYDIPDMYNLYFSSIVVHPDLHDTQILVVLFNAIVRKFMNLGKKEIYFKRIIADAVTEKGERLCGLLGMRKDKNSNHASKIYEVSMIPPEFRVSSKAMKELFDFYLKRSYEIGESTHDEVDTVSKTLMYSEKGRNLMKTNTVFISYSSNEAKTAERVCTFLESNGIPCWIAPRNIDPGSNYASQIVQAIRKCSILVLLASESTNSSGHVSNEISLAFDNKKIIIPFRIEKVSFSDEYLYFLGRKHWIEAHLNFADGLSLLLTTIKQHSENHSENDENTMSQAVQVAKPKLDVTSVFDLSKKYLKSSFRNYHKVDIATFDRQYFDYSALFSLLATVKYRNEIVSPDEGLFDYLYTKLIESENEHSIKILGPSGAEKNVIMQLLYLKLCRNLQKDGLSYVPFYISMNYFEKAKLDITKSIPTQIEQMLREHMVPFIEYCRSNPTLTPVVFIDGIRDYQCGNVASDYILADILNELPEIKYVVDVETGMTANRSRLRKVMPLAPKLFETYVQIKSVDLSDRNQSLLYLQKYDAIYDPSSKIFEKLEKMQFFTIDTYLLRIFSDTVKDNANDAKFSICDLYEAYCLNFFKGRKENLLSAARNAYLYSYTDTEFTDQEFFSGSMWVLLRRHNSFTDFLISYYYIHNLQNFETLESLDVFEMILPKEVTRFIVPRLNDSYSNELKLLNFIEKNYHNLGSRGKSEMTYWLGRIKSPVLSEKAESLLLKFAKDIKEQIETKKQSENYTMRERKEDLVLLRGITVSLIKLGYTQESDDYILDMFNDDLMCSINRGFHLEYYGDKPYIPSHDVLDFEDQLDVGEKTFKQLFKLLDHSIRLGEPSTLTDLNLFTVCSLIQARIGDVNERISFKIDPYILDCIEYVRQYIQKNKIRNDKILLYFKSMLLDFQNYCSLDDKGKYSVVNEVYNTFSEAKKVKRTGWLEFDLPNSENIVEHMYNAWLMGLLYLPTILENYEEYDKNSILEMLIIHDLGETITGDIIKPLKAFTKRFDDEEDFVMKSFLIKGTYPQIANLDRYSMLWDEWVAGESINSHIARDIDTIHAVYQFCKYAIAHPEKFTDFHKRNWLSEMKNLRSDFAGKLFKSLILDNRLFQPLLQDFDSLI